MVSSLLAGIKAPPPLIEGGLMPESLTRRKTAANRHKAAGFKSEWWPDLSRNGGRLQIGTPAGFASEYPAGINRNLHPDVKASTLQPLRAEFSSVFRRTREAYLEHEKAKAELKGLMPEDAKEAIGHGIRAKRSKSGAVSFDILSLDDRRAPVQ
jgi:hypothetical protein